MVPARAGHPRDARAEALAGSRRFLLAFLILVLAGVAAVAAAHVALARHGLLPEPPLAATRCIDEKFLMLREAPLDDRTLLAVGSSTTWRNLDVALLERRLPGTRAYNAAPCYLHADQTAFLAEFLLERMPQVDTVLAVMAPRDFEGCPASQTDFFDPDLAGAFLSRAVPVWLPYVSGFRPPYLWREARTTWRGGPPHPGETAREDATGSSILTEKQNWRPPLVIDPGCYEGLTRLEAAAARHGARLVVATLPVMPAWAAAEDPDGTGTGRWMRDVAGALKRDDSLLIDGRPLGWGDERFADPVHVLYPHHTPLTAYYADAIAAHRRAVPPGPAARDGD